MAAKPPPKKAPAKKQEDSPKDKATLGVADFLNTVDKLGVFGDIEKQIDFISTRSWIIDRLIGDGTGTGAPGGIPRGYITEVFGGESCGKTTLALELVKECQDNNQLPVWIDFEHSLRTQKHYIRNMGISLDRSKFIVISPEDFEQGISLLGKALELKPALIVVDSLSAATPRAVASGEADATATPGLHARLSSLFLSWVNKKLEKANTALVILNQERRIIKASQYDAGPDKTTAGGNAMKFYPSLRIELKSAGKEVVAGKSELTGVDDKKAINATTKVTVIKSKLDMPWRSAPVYIAFGKGIDGLRSLIELAIKKKVITGTGWYEFKHADPRYCFKRQGVQQVQKYLTENPFIITEALQPLCIPEVDNDEKNNNGVDQEFYEEAEDAAGIADLEAGFAKINAPAPAPKDDDEI